MSERINYVPPEAMGATTVQQTGNGTITVERPDIFVPQQSDNGNGHHENGNGYETTLPVSGIIGLGALAVESEFGFDYEPGPLPMSGIIYEREPAGPPVPESLPKGWHKAQMKQYEREWNKRKKTQRLDNYSHAHGQFINTGSGRQYRENGIARPNQRKQNGGR